MRPYRLGHAPCHRPPKLRRGLTDRSTQRRKFAHQIGQDTPKALDSLSISALDFDDGAEGLYDEVNRPLLQMQSAVGETRHDRAAQRLSSSRRA